MNRISTLMRFFLNHSFVRFGLVAGTGWLLDLMVFLALVHYSVRPFWANLCAALVGIGFSFAGGLRVVFQEKHHFSWHKFAIYAVYCLIIVHLMSAFIDLLIVQFAFPPAAVKIGVTPVSFVANYFFMRWLLHRAPKEKQI